MMFENTPTKINTVWYLLKNMANAEKPSIGNKSVRWWAQQATIEVPEIAAEPVTLAFAAARACIFCLCSSRKYTNNPTWVPNPNIKIRIQYQMS